jgi:hypothetical protein
MSARHALSAVTAMPADSCTLALRPVGDPWTDRVDYARHFMARDTGIDKTRPMPLFDKGIAMADAAGFHLNADRIETWLRHLALDYLEGTAWSAYLDSRHF